MSRIQFNRQEPEPSKKPKLTRQKLKTMDDKAAYSALRELYLEHNPYCVRCGQPAEQIHHLLRGANRQRAFLNTDLWVGCCGSACHDAVEKLPWKKQVELKQRAILATVERLRK